MQVVFFSARCEIILSSGQSLYQALFINGSLTLTLTEKSSILFRAPFRYWKLKPNSQGRFKRLAFGEPFHHSGNNILFFLIFIFFSSNFFAYKRMARQWICYQCGRVEEGIQGLFISWSLSQLLWKIYKCLLSLSRLERPPSERGSLVK